MTDLLDYTRLDKRKAFHEDPFLKVIPLSWAHWNDCPLGKDMLFFPLRNEDWMEI
jgi:hypothetical protein